MALKVKALKNYEEKAESIKKMYKKIEIFLWYEEK